MEPNLKNRLSPAEYQVVSLILSDASSGEMPFIAKKLKRSIKTIRNQLCSVYEKLGVRTKFQLYKNFKHLHEEKKYAV